jgi:hypothetical protein
MAQRHEIAGRKIVKGDDHEPQTLRNTVAGPELVGFRPAHRLISGFFEHAARQ